MPLDWFRGNAGNLNPPLDSHNALLFIILTCSLNVIGADRDLFVEKRRAVAEMVCKVKNDWF